jgi:putative membrane protein
MEREVIKHEELKLSDRLAVERTVMAVDRTLMAWVRTSLSLIGFGFTIYKILAAVEKAGGATLVREQTPRNIGVFLILVGVVPLALSMFQYVKGMKLLGNKRSIFLSPSMVAAGAIVLLGLGLLVVVATNSHVI